MSKFDFKNRAHTLRRQGKSVGEIARLLGISKSTSSLWCRQIVLSAKEKDRLRERAIEAGLRGRMIGAEMNRKKKLQVIEDARKWAKNSIKNHTERDLLIAGTALYWAEGSKTDNSTGFIFVNSDSAMITYIKRWLVVIFSINKNELSPTIVINSIHRHRIQKVLQFWASLLELPTSQFGRSVFIKTANKKTYSNSGQYNGLLRLRVKKSSGLKYKVLALIEVLRVGF